MSIDSTVTRRMTMANDVSPEKRFVPSVLPWALSGAALVLYLVTLNHWVSFGSIGNVAMVAGWSWQPELTRPVYWLVTLPVRLLPPGLIPVALNALSAVCAALTLALLARSVALLPHDRTEDQRLREKSAFSLLSIQNSWLPVVLAVLVCGLQLTFWENATAASSEIFDLLLVAYVVRCLLEFRLQGSDSWLLRACVVFGAAMANNWAMVGFLPVFVGAMTWMKGLGFFSFRFLRQAVLLGLLGLCFYLLLPLMAAVSTQGDVRFWDALKWHLADQRQWLGTLVFNKGNLFHGERPLWVLALPSLLPVLAISLKWPSYFGDPSKLGVALATVVFHFVHALLLVVCLWVALDPVFSPRNYVRLAGLPLYYLGALSVGYFAGYFLLVFGGAQPMLRSRPLPGYPPVLNTAVTFAIWVLLLLAPAVMLYRNLPQIRTTNGPMLRSFARLMARDLPLTNTVVLSDDPFRLHLVQAFWEQSHVRNPPFLLDTRSLANPLYHRFLARQHPGSWSVDARRKTPFLEPELSQLVMALSATNSVYYLHPSFGYYFENLYAESLGLVYRLRPYPASALLKPPSPKETLSRNVTFWSEMSGGPLIEVLEAVQRGAQKTQSKPLDRLFAPLLKQAHLTKLSNVEAELLASFYSRAINFSGVELQRNGMLPEAATQFTLAMQLCTNNVVAEINLACNRSLDEKTGSIQGVTSAEEQLGRYRNLQDAMNENGPFDDGTFCYLVGRGFFVGGNYRQAAQELNRAAQLLPEKRPENLLSRLLLARSSMVLGLTDEGVKIISEIHNRSAALGLSSTNAPDLMQVEAIAYFMRRDTNAAQSVIATALKTYPGDVGVIATATKLYLDSGLTNSAFDTLEAALKEDPRNEALLATAGGRYLEAGRYADALRTAEQQLKIQPDNGSAFYLKGLAYLGLDAFTNAAAAFTPVIDKGTNAFPELYYNALINRAYAFWKGENLDDAQRDYEQLLAAFPKAIQFAYGLGDICYRKNDTNSAVRYYKLFLERAPTNAPETSNTMARLKELRRNAH